MNLYTSLLSLFNKSVIGGVALNFNMAAAQTHGRIWVPSATAPGSSVALPFKVYRVEGLKARPWVIIRSLRDELVKMGVDVSLIRDVEFTHLPDVVYRFNDVVSEKLNIPLV